MVRDYYEEINKVVTEYEEYKPWHTKSLDWASDRVCWAWKWKKITKPQMEELADRITVLYESMR